MLNRYFLLTSCLVFYGFPRWISRWISNINITFFYFWNIWLVTVMLPFYRWFVLCFLSLLDLILAIVLVIYKYFFCFIILTFLHRVLNHSRLLILEHSKLYIAAVGRSLFVFFRPHTSLILKIHFLAVYLNVRILIPLLLIFIIIYIYIIIILRVVRLSWRI